MAQIFISHSKKDKEVIDFLSKAFDDTKVKPHLEELEKELPTGVTAAKIERDIQASNAVFVLLTETVEKLKHTRDWVVWECGVAKNKDIWVFEPFTSLGEISVVVPHFNHYVLFEQTEEWRKYLLAIIESYDDSHVLPTVAKTSITGSALGALIDEKNRVRGTAIGAALGGLAGLFLSNKPKRSFGIDVRCQECSSNYTIHIPYQHNRFRCAVCNAYLGIQEPQFAEDNNESLA
jgi:ribosomal protein S27E